MMNNTKNKFYPIAIRAAAIICGIATTEALSVNGKWVYVVAAGILSGAYHIVIQSAIAKYQEWRHPLIEVKAADIPVKTPWGPAYIEMPRGATAAHFVEQPVGKVVDKPNGKSNHIIISLMAILALFGCSCSVSAPSDEAVPPIVVSAPDVIDIDEYDAGPNYRAPEIDDNGLCAERLRYVEGDCTPVQDTPMCHDQATSNAIQIVHEAEHYGLSVVPVSETPDLCAERYDFFDWSDVIENDNGCQSVCSFRFDVFTEVWR